jgi:hypothetical protein
MTQTRLPVASRHFGRTIMLCIVLLLLIQAGLGLLNLYPFLFPPNQLFTWLLFLNRIPILSRIPVLVSFINIWTVGMAFSYFLAGWLSALYTTRGHSPRRARSKGALVGAIEGIGSVVLATLLLGGVLFWFIQRMQAQVEAACGAHPGHYCGLGFGLTVLIFLIKIVRPFLIANLLGIVLTPLGGVLGGYQRARTPQGEPPTPEEPGGKIWSRGAVAVFIIATLLAVLQGGIFILLPFN